MKKIKGYGYLPVMLAMLACSKSSNTSIVGTWQATTSTDVLVDSLHTPITATPNNTTYSKTSTLVFYMHADNTYTVADTRFTQSPYYDSGNYTVLKTQLVLTSIAEAKADTIDYTQKGSKLTTVQHYYTPGVSSETVTINFQKL